MSRSMALDKGIFHKEAVATVTAAERAENSILQRFSSSGSAGMNQACLSSFAMILVSEIGDETFIIAALMAMRHSRSLVLSGALSALLVMTILSVSLGMVVPTLLSQKTTSSAACFLYTIFGVRLLYMAWKADASVADASIKEEMAEVEEKIGEGLSGVTGGRFKRTLKAMLSPVFIEAFVLTFLAEWGDRSQIATIALAAHNNPIGVILGATLGHAVCSSIAVYGGRFLAMRISARTVAMTGGIVFLIFALHSYLTVFIWPE